MDDKPSGAGSCTRLAGRHKILVIPCDGSHRTLPSTPLRLRPCRAAQACRAPRRCPLLFANGCRRPQPAPRKAAGMPTWPSAASQGPHACLQLHATPCGTLTGIPYTAHEGSAPHPSRPLDVDRLENSMDHHAGPIQSTCHACGRHRPRGFSHSLGPDNQLFSAFRILRTTLTFGLQLSQYASKVSLPLPPKIQLGQWSCIQQ